ncbi:alternative ribosome rescue aminoacyl-tRNA hydrolase ArfB [Actinotalea ferrariae]|uniref:alternative ribosome rescue aminoacyl-tRNA hydrolase ArfB n=1 Tax=Actinotalea ferrariae TaxID=1386098 RepID=UPI001C8C13A5|nr:alternative ribosome rescue aminoacyl-tRNA hydrolase ArfB [Actinotalea ferrariae]
MEIRVRRDVVVVDDAELRWRFSRSSGPGGQGVNTTDSRVELSWDLARSPALPDELRDRAVAALAHRLTDGVLTVAASEHRSQLRNREAATARLVRLVEQALEVRTPRQPTRPSRASRTRRSAAEQKRREVKELRRRPRRTGPE